MWWRRPATPGVDPRAAGIGPMSFDGWIVTAAALASGLDLVVYPRQIVATAETEAEAMSTKRLSFVHGVPSGSTLSAVTFAQDKRIRRALFETAGIPMPAGASFSYNSDRDIKRYVERIGFPVVVKEVVGENFMERFGGVGDLAQLERVIRRLRERQGARLHSASNLERSAYAMTGLRVADEDDETGQRLAPVDTRFLVERDMDGDYYRFLVLGDVVVTVLRFPEGPASPDHDAVAEAVELRDPASSRRLQRGRLHQAYADVARRSVSVIAGLELAAVDIVIADPTRRPKRRNHWVVELSERPHLEVLHALDPVWAFGLAHRIVRHEAARVARPLTEAVEQVAAKVAFAGVSAVPAFAEQSAAFAAEHGLQLAEASADGASARAIFDLKGSPQAVALLIERAMGGGFERQYPRLAEVRVARGQW